jgi:NAD(P)-dependent dehydrogenase (short-subunit alcohol dehydrogenase family)
MLALVQEFLPHMLEQGDGAILTAQGGSTVQGLPNMSGPSPAQAAQRNYLQALHAEVAGKGVYVGMLYIGAAIENSAFHTEMEKAKAAGDPVWEMPTVDPEHLAELLWTMHLTKEPREAIYPPRRLRDPPPQKAEELPPLHGRALRRYHPCQTCACCACTGITGPARFCAVRWRRSPARFPRTSNSYIPTRRH